MKNTNIPVMFVVRLKHMTLLVAWAGIDSRDVASVYIATDSRVSWESGVYFDSAIKTFALSRFPAVIGYCGDSLVSQMLISQAISITEALPVNSSLTLEGVADLIVRIIHRNYQYYPKEKTTGSFRIVVCGKKQFSSASDFECYSIDSDFNETKKQEIVFPTASGPLVVAGSGKNNFESIYSNIQVSNNPNQSTSRNVFHAFYESISNSTNQTVGGVPQVVYVYRKPNTAGSHSGIVQDEKRYIAGQFVDRDIAPNDIQWFNNKFELTDSQTKRRSQGAQIQPPYSGLSSNSLRSPNL